MKRTIGEKYNVIFAEKLNGEFESELMTLEKISEENGIEIFIYRDSMGYEFATYEHNENIDWNFIEKINNNF